MLVLSMVLYLLMSSVFKNQKPTGFTIVELLIVIVVIAILASISVVGYTGIQKRADRSAVVTHLKEWEKVFSIYISENGRVPQADWRCLGDATTLAAENGYADNFCFKPTNIHTGGNTGTTAPADPALMETLKADGLITSFPGSRFPEVEAMMANSDEGNQRRIYRGIFFDSSTNNFADYPAILGYFVRDSTCPIGERVGFWATLPGVSGCVVKLPVNSSGQSRNQCNIAASQPDYNSYIRLRSEGNRTVYCYQGNQITL